MAASIGKLYSSQPATLLPAAPSEWQKMTSLVVKLLAGYRCKNPHPITNVVSTSFVEKADLVSDILSRIWGQSLETRACIQESLRLFYVIISTSDSDSRPSCALMSFIDKVPSNMMEKAMETIIDDSNHNQIQAQQGQVHRIKGDAIELKMASAVPKRVIAHLLKISAQSEQLCESFTLNA